MAEVSTWVSTMPNSLPWIVTDEHLPCLVIEGQIVPTVDTHDLKALLGAAFPRVGNVYNCPAFRLDDVCEEVFCLRPAQQVALVYIGLDTSVRLENAFSELQERIGASKKAIDVVLETRSAQLMLSGIKLEITGKSPN